ncbi:MAG TPA: LppP/LprE family lipoprotein, partial [Solirubrobacteraceae bacterium]|nr:LppP/LprE family lipoprotein [Solirubrobacteraceae bacterium]
FDGPRYLGTDASAPSGQIAVVGNGDTDVRLRYALYRSSDPDCCPTGTPRTVDFTLDGGHLVAADPIPAVADRR